MTRINYERVNWQDYPNTPTPLNSDNLNNMDNGLASLYADVADLEAALEELVARVDALTNEDDLLSGEEVVDVSESH